MNAHSALAAPAVRQASAEDRGRIEAFARTHPDATPFHLPQWAEGVARGAGHRTDYLLCEAEGRITGLLPLTHVRSPIFGSALVSTGFAVDGGIISDNPLTAEALARAATAHASALGCRSLELRGGPIPDGWQACDHVYAGFARTLPSGGEAILKSIPRKQRAEVRRALGSDLQVSIGRDAAAHYGVYAESVRNLGTPVFPRQLFIAMMEAFGDDADIVLISKDGQPVSAVLSLYFGGTVYPFWGGGTRAARALRANELLYFALMRHAAERGCTRFDFGRSKVGTGAYAYKKNWGFEPKPLAYARWGEVRDTNPLSPKYRLQVALWKKLPLGLANAIGPLISRGLG